VGLSVIFFLSINAKFFARDFEHCDYMLLRFGTHLVIAIYCVFEELGRIRSHSFARYLEGIDAWLVAH
jgi:hypothetical protein